MLNYVHIMIYDLAGASWDDTTRHHAPLYGYEGPSGDPANGTNLTKYNSHYAIQAYRFVMSDDSGFSPDAENGPEVIPAAKLTFGVPMYGRGFKSVDAGDWDGYGYSLIVSPRGRLMATAKTRIGDEIVYAVLDTAPLPPDE